MSDILKKAKEKERMAGEEKGRKDKGKERQEKSLPIEPKPVRQEAPPEPVRPVKEVVTPEVKAHEAEKPEAERQPEIKEQEKEKAKNSGVRISPVVMKGAKIASSEESLRLYEESISLMREILKEDIDCKSIDIKRITAWIEKIVNQLSLGDEKILRLALINDSVDRNYLLCHSINVCIFAIKVGLGLGYNKSKLMELGISALLHDMGMIKFRHLSDLPRKFTAKEQNEIKDHPIVGSELLEKIKNLNKIVVHVAYQQHERVDGSGYPRGLRGGSIKEYAKIVGIVDVFEAMIHQRLYRDEFLPVDATRKIIANKNSFEHKLAKILIESIGIFPVGSFVELNTKEIGRVIKLNCNISVRPVVEILFGADGEKPKERRILDLTTQPTICIKKALKKNEFKTSPSR